MQAFTSIDFYRQGTKVGGPWYFNIINVNPGLGDVWNEFLAALQDLYNWLAKEDQAAADALVADILNLMRGKDVKVGSASQTSFGAGGRVVGVEGLADTAEVLFRAWSDDDLTQSFGRVDQPNTNVQVVNLGEWRYRENDNNIYDHWFSMPLSGLAAGTYAFTFGSGDDGWYFDVGIASVLTISVTPRPRPPWLDNIPRDLLLTLSPSEMVQTVQAKGPRPASRILTLAEAQALPSPRHRAAVEPVQPAVHTT